MSLFMVYATALLLGSLHAAEADHMAAVTSFAVRRPGVRAAVGFGVRWSAGHGGAIVVIGAGLLLLGINVSDATTHWLERLVGVMMIGLGAWTLRGAGRLHAHRHVHAPAHQAHETRAAPGPARAEVLEHAHLHSHALQDDHQHGHAVTAVGLLHGLAGSGSAVALIPVIGFDSPVSGILYLVVFALGTIAAMAVYGMLAGLVVGRAAENSVRLARLLARGTGAITIMIGMVWLLR